MLSVKLLFENIIKTEHLFSIAKGAATFDKKALAYQKKRTANTREESFEELVTEDYKEHLITKKLKKVPITENLKKTLSLRENCPNTEFFLVCIFPNSDLSISPYSVRMGENKDQKKLRIWTIFTQAVYH